MSRHAAEGRTLHTSCSVVIYFLTLLYRLVHTDICFVQAWDCHVVKCGQAGTNNDALPDSAMRIMLCMHIYPAAPCVVTRIIVFVQHATAAAEVVQPALVDYG